MNLSDKYQPSSRPHPLGLPRCGAKRTAHFPSSCECTHTMGGTRLLLIFLHAASLLPPRLLLLAPLGGGNRGRCGSGGARERGLQMTPHCCQGVCLEHRVAQHALQSLCLRLPESQRGGGEGGSTQWPQPPGTLDSMPLTSNSTEHIDNVENNRLRTPRLLWPSVS